MFKLKIYLDSEQIIKAKAERISGFDPIFQTLKKKFGEINGRGKE